MLHKHVNPAKLSEDERALQSMAYSSRYAVQEIPKYKLPHDPTDAKVAYQLIHDELELDGRPAMNLASFVHTWMEDEADKLVMENISKNLADQDEYPATMTIQGRCISVIGNLWHAEAAIGTATVGSSEAIMLGGLALKKRWQERQRTKGKDASRPNILMGNNAQVALEKFARYFDVEMRLIPVSEESHHILDIHKAVEACDENTIGIYCILGSTYTGHFEDVLGLSKLLDDFESKTGLDIAIHVDAASGGFVAPFGFPDLKWDFQLPRVVSINASGHKFGLSYCGIGWVLWRAAEFLPKELVFELDYLGGIEYTYNINFSRPACFMISQYYNFIRLGYTGYKRVMENDLTNARILSYALEETGVFDIVSDLHRPLGVFGYKKKGKEQVAQAKKKGTKEIRYNPSLPVVSFKLTEEFKRKHPHVQQAAVSTLLRTKGWIVPNYNLPPAEHEVEILRVVVRESLSRDMIDQLVQDIRDSTEKLKQVEEEASDMLADIMSVSTKHKYESHEHRNVKRSKTFSSTC